MIKIETETNSKNELISINSTEIRKELNFTSSLDSGKVTQFPSFQVQPVNHQESKKAESSNTTSNIKELSPVSKRHEINLQIQKRLIEIKAIKENGDNQFREKYYLVAIDQYSIALNLLKELRNLFPREKGDLTLHVKILANISNCLIKLNRFEESLAFNLQIIKLDPYYIKAYYRAGVALKSLDRQEEAVSVLRQGMPYVKESDDTESRKLYILAYNEAVRACNNSYQEMQNRMEGFFSANQSKKNKIHKQAIFEVSRSKLLYGLSSGVLMGSLFFVMSHKVKLSSASLATNAIGSVLTLGAVSYKNKALCVGGLCLFNFLLFKYFK